MSCHVLVVEFTGFNVSLLVVVRPFQYGPAPLAEQSLSHPLDAGLWLLAPSVEKNHFTDTAAQESLFLNVQPGQG